MAISETKYPVLHCNPDQFIFTINNNDHESEFDLLLKRSWESAKCKKIFRYELNITKWKRLAGRFEFLAQLNIDRAQNRRTPENIFSMNTPFSKEDFNFTIIKEKEIFFNVSSGDGDNVIAGNVSPFEYGHCLFLPERLKCLPQKVTKYSLLKIVQLLLLSASPYLRAVFNSLGAYASVNHLHWHLYYLKHKMLLEKIDLESHTDLLCILTKYPAKGFCFKLSSFPENDINSFVSSTFNFINYLQEHEIAHNIYITRAMLSQTDKYHNDVRIYVWARAPSFGIKDSSTFIPAVCEFFGHLVIGSEHAYEILDEDEVSKYLSDVTSATFEYVLRAIESRCLVIT